MNKFAFAVVAAVMGAAGSAWAAPQTWLVTEENVAGVKGAQGSWTMSVEGNAFTGTASMQSGNGNMLTYKIDGSIEGANYTAKMSERTDGKKNCVWSGHPPSGASTQSHGLLGYAECEGAKLVVRVSPVAN